MIDIFSIPVYYISFKKNKKLEENLFKRGFSDISHFPAIDGYKLDPKKLIKDKVITIRSFSDLINRREQHSGIPSLGAIGCTFSHSKLWKLCVDKNLPFITIVESDTYIPELSPDKIQNISRILTNKKSVFISSKITKTTYTHFVGLHFYIISQDACKELLNDVLPIDVQTDWYIAHKDTIGDINIEGFHFVDTKPHASMIQDICIKCIMPNNLIFYVIFVVLFCFIGFIINGRRYNN